MHRLILIPVLLMQMPVASQATTCEALQAQIDAKIKAGGVSQFTLMTVDAAATAPGRVVGRCERGSRKILYQQAPSAGKRAPGTAPADTILTECKDGTVSMGGSCRK